MDLTYQSKSFGLLDDNLLNGKIYSKITLNLNKISNLKIKKILH